MGDLPTLRCAIAQGLIAEHGDCGHTLLTAAAMRGLESSVTELLNAHADAKALTTDGDAALHLAAGADASTAALEAYVRICRQLLDRGAIRDAVNSSGQTPLYCAARSGSEATCAVLLDAGAAPDLPADAHGDTALVAAVMRRHHSMCALLLAHGANPTRHPALSIAIDHGDRVLAEMLLKAGARADGHGIGGNLPLHRAVVNADAAALCLLLFDNGAAEFINVTNADGDTPLHMAARETSDCSLLQLLIDNGADETLRNNRSMTPADVAVHPSVRTYFTLRAAAAAAAPAAAALAAAGTGSMDWDDTAAP